jgi:gluconate 2-dehydrogenase gamma chain
MEDLPRRKFIAVAGTSVAAAWLLADQRNLQATAEYVARLGQAQAFETLTADEAAVLEAASAQIIPTDELPGAREARVVNFIDRSISTWAKEQRPVMAKLVKELNSRARKTDRRAASFAALTEAQQEAIIASLEKERHQSFFALRGATIVGMFANPEYGGNFEKRGWQALGFVDQFSWAAPFGWYDR